jgi:hypothetical protein
VTWSVERTWQCREDGWERGLLENAIVAVTADHGEQFVDHGALYHANGLYNEEVLVDAEPGGSVEGPVAGP